MNNWQIAGIKIRIKVGFVISSLILLLLFYLAAKQWLSLSSGQIVIGSIIALLLHWLSEWLHQWGHAFAGKREGHSMSHMIFTWFLIATLYPRDEPPLPAETHIKRALGGPFVSFILSLLGGLLLLIMPANNSLLGVLTAFFFWENFLVFFLGAFLPLGFTDGSTLIHWWPKRGLPASAN